MGREKPLESSSSGASPARGVVLVGINGSLPSQAALAWTLTALLLPGDQLVLLHVIKPLKHVPSANGVVPVFQLDGFLLVDAIANQQRQAEILLDQAQLDCKLRGFLAETLLRRDEGRQSGLLAVVRQYQVTDLVLGANSSQQRRNARGASESLSSRLAAVLPRSCHLHLVRKATSSSGPAEVTPIPIDAPQRENSANGESSWAARADVSRARSPPVSISSRPQLVVPSSPLASSVGSDITMDSPEEEATEAFVLAQLQQKRAIFSPKIVASSPSARARFRVEKQAVSPQVAKQGAATYAKPTHPTPTPTPTPPADSSSPLTRGLVPAGPVEEEQAGGPMESAGSGRPEGGFQVFSAAELAAATAGFDESRLVLDGRVSRVYRGKLPNCPDTIAVTVMKVRNVHCTAEFEAAVRALASKDSRHLLRILGCCPQSGCVVKELRSGIVLKAWLHGWDDHKRLPVPARFRIATEIVAGLSALHSQPYPVLHQDLRPSTVIVTSDLHVKLGDAGMSGLFTTMSLAEAAISGPVPLEVLAYMDPEFTSTGTTTKASDVYAFGLTLLEILTSRSAIGLKAAVQTALRENKLESILDSHAGEWPLEETIEAARLAIRCLELRRADRPNIDSEVLPLLQELSTKISSS